LKDWEDFAGSWGRAGLELSTLGLRGGEIGGNGVKMDALECGGEFSEKSAHEDAGRYLG
jgi:hypothetical protein